MEEQIRALSKYRFETSLEDLADAEFSAAIRAYLEARGVL